MSKNSTLRSGKCTIPITILDKKNCSENSLDSYTAIKSQSFPMASKKESHKYKRSPPKASSLLYTTKVKYLVSRKEPGAKKFTNLTHNIYDSTVDKYICMYATKPKEQKKLYKTIVTQIGIENVCINQIPKNADYRLFFDLDFNKGSLTSTQRQRVIKIYHEQAELVSGCKLKLLLDVNKGNYHGRFNLKLRPNVQFLMPKDIETHTVFGVKMNTSYENSDSNIVHMSSDKFRSLIVDRVLEECIKEFPDVPRKELEKQIDNAYGIRTPLCSKAETKSKTIFFNKRSYYRNNELKRNMDHKIMVNKLMKYDICNVKDCIEPVFSDKIIKELLARITKHTQHKAEPSDYRGCQIGKQVNIGDDFTPINYTYTKEEVQKIINTFNPCIVTSKKSWNFFTGCFKQFMSSDNDDIWNIWDAFCAKAPNYNKANNFRIMKRLKINKDGARKLLDLGRKIKPNAFPRLSCVERLYNLWRDHSASDDCFNKFGDDVIKIEMDDVSQELPQYHIKDNKALCLKSPNTLKMYFVSLHYTQLTLIAFNQIYKFD